MDREGFDEALDSLDSLVADYDELSRSSMHEEARDDARLRPAF